ncbi:MAG: PqqD family protein [Actinomycetota bacterium]
MLEGESRVVATAGQLSSDLGDGERVILSIDRGLYFGVDGVGSLVWQRLQEPVTIAALCADVERAYEIDHGRCESDMVGFVGELVEQGLATVVDGPDTSVPVSLGS